MILDKETLFADSLAYDGSPSEIDLGAARPGPGMPIKCFFTTEEALTGATGIQVLDAPHTVPDENVMLINAVPGAGETIEFELPSDVQQFVNISLAGTVTAGVFSCGIVLPGVQTNT